VDVIVWLSILKKFRKEIFNASLLGIYGQSQADGEVKHLVAQYAVDLSSMLGALDTGSRNFCRRRRCTAAAWRLLGLRKNGETLCV
jgi:error-prone DNA polymerase